MDYAKHNLHANDIAVKRLHLSTTYDYISVSFDAIYWKYFNSTDKLLRNSPFCRWRSLLYPVKRDRFPFEKVTMGM